MAKQLKELLEEMASRGLFVINLFQTQQRFDDIRKKHWRCNLMEESTGIILDVGLGQTLEEAMEAAIRRADETPSRSVGKVTGIPSFLKEKAAASSLEDML